MNRPSFFIFLILLLLFAGGEVLAGTDYQATSAELERLRTQIQQVQSGLSQERRRQDRVTRELRELDGQVARATARIRELHREQRRLAASIAELQREHAEQEQQLSAHRDHLAQQLLNAYVSGREEYLRLLLNQEDPNRVDRVLVYYDYLNRARGERIRETSGRIRRLAEIETELASERKALGRSQLEHEREQERLQAARGERARLLARIERDISSKDQQLTRLQRDEGQLVQLLEGLQAVLADIPEQELARVAFRQRRGRLDWPLRGQLAARYGASRGIGDSRWNGILIEAAEGTQVQAVAHGRVVFADWLRGFGLLAIIDHGDGFMTLYGHNEALYKEAGSWVQPGEMIASVGASGGRRGPGLYFELRSNGRPVDPLPWLRPLGG